MAPWGPDGRTATVPASVVAGIGTGLVVVHLAHAAEELGGNVPAVFYGSVLPLVVSGLVAAGGYWVVRREWTDVSPWRSVAWVTGGAVVAAGIAELLVRHQAAEGVALRDATFVRAMLATYGAGIGLAIGRYDVRVREAKRALAAKSRRLDEFASIVSHDLRNPLNVAQGYVERARTTGDVSDLSRVEAAHDRMRTIVEDMLALARSGGEAIDPTDVGLPAAARRAWRTVDTGETGLRVAVDEGVRIRADPDRLHTLFENLFHNAAEHNDGPVTVTVGTCDGGFYVADTGSGVAPGNRERVFEAGFSRTGGTGLGLPIVRAAADAHGWSCVLGESEAGGARFEFSGVSFVGGAPPDRSD